MSRFQKPYMRWWLSLCSLGFVVCVVYAAVVAAQPKGAPKELKLGFVDFFSGAGAIFGVSGKNTAELLVDKWNKEGGIKGVPVKMIEVDENGGPDKQVTEYRRLVLDDGKVIADGPPASVLAYPEVRKAVLGQEEPCCKWMVSASRSRVFVFCVVSVWTSPQAG